MPTTNPTVSLREVAPDFKLRPFQTLLHRFITEALAETGQDACHGNTVLVPVFLVWVVLALTLRRDLDALAVLDWLLSGLRWLDLKLALHTVAEGTLSRARARLGWQVFALLFQKVTDSFTDLQRFSHECSGC